VMATAEIIERIVATFPPLTAEQKDRIVLLVREGGESRAESTDAA
jgi:hypothetical protein